MKSVFRTIVTEPDGSQVQKVVLAQPNATTGNPAIGEALNAAVAAAGTGAVGQSCAWVGDATVNATAPGGTGTQSLYNFQVQGSNGQMLIGCVLARPTTSPVATAINAALSALLAAYSGFTIQSINQLAAVDIDATS